MPQFYGHDYYLLAIADQAAQLNKAILAIPQSLQKHVNNCCLNVLELLDPCSNGMKDFPNLSEADLQDFNSDVLFVHGLQGETVEPYEKDVITGYDGEELLEIIPSSNPESSCSLVGSLNTEECVVNTEEPSCFETFDSMTLCTENLQTFDEPMNVNHFRLAIEALPSISVLLSRLKSVDLEDPLLPLAGTKWKDRDFQCIADSHNDWSTEVLNVEEGHTFKELFNTFFMEVSSEALLPYSVPSTKYETNAADIYSSDYIATLTHSDYGIVEEQDYLTEDTELVISQLTSGLSNVDKVCSMDDDDDSNEIRRVYNTSTAAHTVLENLDCHPQPGQSNCGSQKCLSPFVEHRSVEIVNDDDVLSKALLEALLETLAAEEVLWSACSLLGDELRNVERHIWEEEKHFDEIQFSEPMLKQESLSNPTTEASVCLGLQLEDIEPEHERLQWSFDEPEDRSSVYEIAILSDDVCVHQLDDSEIFDKFQTSELDYMLTSRCEQSKSLVFNDCTQDETVDCVDSHAANVDSEDNVFQPLDPLDSFIYVRARSGRLGKIGVQSSVHKCDKTKCTDENHETNVLTSVAASPSNQQHANIKTMEAVFSGLWENVMQCIIDSAAVYLENMKREALIPHQQGLMDVSIDMTRFLLKEREKQMSDVTSQGNSHTSYSQKDNILQSLAIVHILRTAADLLLHSCLESCITYLAAHSEDRPAQITKSCSEVHQQLFHYQCQFLQENRTHPKLSVLINEVGKCSIELPTIKILILVQKGLKSLVCAVQSALCQIPRLTVTIVEDWKCVETRQPKTAAFIANAAEARAEIMSKFSLVILYDERQNAHIKSWCQDRGISCTGLLTQYSCATHLTDKPDLQKKMVQISLVCSIEVTQHTQLVCLLETGYNILVIEREYHKLCRPGTKIYFADLIVSPTHCIVLLSIQDMKKHWDLTTAVTRFVALGLQFSQCCVILHGMDAGNSYVLEKETLSNIYKLTAALCNLKGASSAFDASYKVFISLTDEDVAACIRNIVDHYLSHHSESDLLRPWLSADASQNETMLLQLTCMNSFSAQMLLHRLPISEILEKSDGELAALFPDIPEKTFKYLHNTTSSLSRQQSGLSNSSQNSCLSEVSSLNSFTMRAQTNSTLSHTMNDDDNDVKLASTATSDLGIMRNVCQQPMQTIKSVHSLGINVRECHSPAHATLKTRYKNSYNLLSDENYNLTAEEHRSRLVKQHGLSESAACNNVDSHLQSLAGSGECSPLHCEEQMCQSEYVRLVSGVPQDVQHNLVSVCENGSIAETQLTADLQKVCHGPQQINNAQKGTGSHRSSLTQPGSSIADNNPYRLGLLVGCEGNYWANPLQDNKTSRDGYCNTQELQSKSNSHSLSPSGSYVFRNTSGDEDSIQCFHRKIARAMQTLDIESCDEDPNRRSITFMQQRRYESEPDSNYKPHRTDKSDREIMLKHNEGDLSPFLRQTHPVSCLGNTYGECNTQDESAFNFAVSNTTDTEKSLLGLPLLFDPVKKEIEDIIYEDNRFDLTDESAKVNTAAAPPQKPTYSLRNDSQLHSYEVDNCEDKAYINLHNFDKFKPSFLNGKGNSSFRLSDYLYAGDRASVPDTDSHSIGTSFGLFSTKAHRCRDIPSTSDDNRSQTPNNTTMTASEHSRSGGDHVFDAPAFPGKQFRDGLLSTVATTDRAMNLDSLPFSVSKELRKHIRKHRTQDYNPSRFLPQGNQNSVRVSRPPDYGNSRTNISNCDDFTSSVYSHMRNPVIQQEFQNVTRVSDTSLLQNIGQMRNSIREQEFQNYTRKPDTSLLQSGGQMRHSVTQQRFQNYIKDTDASLYQNVGQMRNSVTQEFQHCTKEPDTSLLINTSQVWTRYPLASDCVQPTSRYGSCTTKQTQIIPFHQTHITNSSERNLQANNYQRLAATCYAESSRTNSPPDFVRSVTVPSLYEKCPPTNSSSTKTVQSIRQSAMPYTPRHGITVGLAQPFRRQSGSVGPPDLDPTRQPSASHVSQRADESPPMDLVPDDDGNNFRNDDNTTDCNKYVSEVKRMKWNQHLLSCSATNEDKNRTGTSHFDTHSSAGSSSVPCPSANRKRKLQLETRAGNKGQTVLVFK